MALSKSSHQFLPLIADLVREYLGEAYVIQGKYDLAREQLAIVKGICGTDCEYFAHLARAIEDGNVGGW